MIDRDFMEADAFQKIGGILKAACKICGCVRIRTKCDDLAAKLSIAFQNGEIGVGIAELIAESRGVELKPLSFLMREIMISSRISANSA